MLVEEPVVAPGFGLRNFSDPQFDPRSLMYHIWGSLNGGQYVEIHGPNSRELNVLSHTAWLHFQLGI